MTGTKEKVLLAYSGGLDTSCILAWLLDQVRHIDSLCTHTNTNNYRATKSWRTWHTLARKKTLKRRAKRRWPLAHPTCSSRCAALHSCHLTRQDLRNEFVNETIFPAIQANCIYEGVYLLGTALARPVIAKKQARVFIARAYNIRLRLPCAKGASTFRTGARAKATTRSALSSPTMPCRLRSAF
jgi:argininosuccinate synthase